METLKLLLITATLYGLTACGGGGSDDPTILEGYFKDTGAGGVEYQAGGITSVTDEKGRFMYESGDSVTFSVGNVVLGTTKGKSVVTPVDFVNGGSSDSIRVQNIVRFLLMLDGDNIPDNGIAISPTLSSFAIDWDQVDFDTNDLDAELVTNIADANTADGRTHVLPNAATAKSHLESTLLCTRSGAYRGTFNGDATGPFGFWINAQTGLLTGFAFSSEDLELLTLSGTSSISFDQNATFISGDTNTGSTFNGAFSGPDGVTGIWSNVSFGTSGNFAGNRIGGDLTAVHRFTGTFTGDAFGLFSFDVDLAGNVTGFAHTVLALADGTTNELAPLTGTLTGTSFTAIIADAGVVDATISGSLNTTTGTANGTWSDADGNSGSFVGSGCKL